MTPAIPAALFARFRAFGALVTFCLLSTAYAQVGWVGLSNALTVNLNSTAVDVRGLLHASESTAGQTLTWSQSVAPLHGTLAFTGATAASGSTDITPGGTITYTPTTNFTGTDSFAVRVSDGTNSATKTIVVTFLGQGTAGSQFVAVGDTGTLLTSPDAVTWTSRTSGTTARLRGATASGNLIVAVGQSGTILTSPDGITWTARTSGVTETLRGVTASPTRFVTVGGDTTSMIRYSDDGTTWSGATVSNLGRLRAVVWGGSQFVAVGPAGAVLTSPDGVAWTQQSAGTTDELDGVLWNGSKYVVLTATGKVLTSTDGVSWSSAQANPPSWVEGLTWSNTQFVTVGASGKAKTSPDGTTWTWKSSGTTNTLHGVAWTGVFAGQTADPVAVTNNLRKITISGVTAANKIYDGAVTAVLNVLNAVLNGVNSGDTVTLSTSSAAGAFADKTVANGKTVTTSGFSISGTNAGDYTLVQPSTTANITAAGLTITSVTASNKTYDGGTTATLNTGSAALSGVVSGDTVTLGVGSATGAFGDKTVANGKTVTTSGFTIGGTDAANYSLTQPTATANITAASLTVTGVGASNKTYDGTTAATLTGTATLNGVVSGDTVTLGTSGATGAFADRNVGTGKSVTASGYTIGGTDSGDYLLSQPTGITANISAKTLTASGLTASNKTYDGTTAAALTGTAALQTAEAAGGGTTGDGKPYSVDTVNLSGTASGAFSDQNVGSGKTVTVSGLSLAGTQAANYVLGSITTTASIGAKALTLTGLTANNRTYDGTSTATLAGTAALLTAEAPGGGTAGDGAPYAGDTVAPAGTATATFASKDVAKGIAVSVSGFTLSGAQASNYSVTQPTALTANITAKTLTVSGVTAANKVYDGTTAASLSGTAVLAGAETAGAGTTSDGKPYSGDTLSLSGTMSGAFADKNAATGKTITVTGLTLGGAQAGDYVLGGLTVTADITAKPLTVSGLAASNKIYDGTTTAALTGTAALATAEATGAGTTADGIPYTGDTVTLAGTAAGTFASKVVANGVAVTVSGITLSGAQASNYSATQPTGLTANITAKGLTVSGATANNKTYDGGTSATLNFGSATLVGVVTGDTVTLATTSAAGAFADANVGTGKAVTITGVALGGADAGNYTVTQPSTTAAITPAVVTVTLTNLNQTYTGSARTVIVTASPSVATTVTYNGSTTPPATAGSYAVSASVTNANYSGGTSGTLTIAPASQTVSFALGTGTIGSTVPLSATASSGLSVTFSIVSGSGAINGSTLSITGPGSLTVRATQAGNNNYLSASADATISNIAKLDQTISFGSLSDKRANDAAVTLNATASSGLPVTFTVSAGPAMLAGNTVTFTGAPGQVTIRASQAGNAVYNAAPDVTQTFNVVGVSPFIYFGAIGGSGMAAQISSDGKSGTMIGTLLGTGEGFVVNFTPSATGDFVATVTTFGGTSSTAATADLSIAPTGGNTSPRAALSTPASPTEQVNAASTGTTRTFRGNVSGGVLVGSVDGLNATFSAALVPATGPTAAIAGFYQSSSLDTSTGSIYSVVGTTNQVYVLAVTPTYVGGSSGTATNTGAFNVQAPGQTTINGAVDASTTTVTGSLTQPGAPTQSFSGLAVTTTRTDRLINLSSRGQVTGGNGVLISGFVIGGSASKTVLLRGVGPGLSALGVPGALANPSLQLYDSSGKLLVTNAGWGSDSTLGATFARLGAFALAPGSHDAAMTATLAPGAYTMVITNAGNDAGGVALAEIYDASANPAASYQRLVNISARGTVGTGASVLFGGFVVTGNSPKKLLIRGVGPGLVPLGVSNAIADPQLQVFDSQANLLAQNDNWSTPQAVTGAQTPAAASDLITAANATGAFALASGSKDAALIVTLAPGQYTTQVSGVGGATGTALVEIYEIPTN